MAQVVSVLAFVQLFEIVGSNPTGGQKLIFLLHVMKLG